MEGVKDGLSFKGVAERLTLGITRVLGMYDAQLARYPGSGLDCWLTGSVSPVGSENMPGVVDVRFAEREPAEKRNLLSWEQVMMLTDDTCRGKKKQCCCFCYAFFFVNVSLRSEKQLHFARGPA